MGVGGAWGRNGVCRGARCVTGVCGGCSLLTLTGKLLGVCGTPVVGAAAGGGVATLVIFSVFIFASGAVSFKLPALTLAGVAESARSPSIGDFFGLPTLSLTTFGFTATDFSTGNSGGNLSTRLLYRSYKETQCLCRLTKMTPIPVEPLPVSQLNSRPHCTQKHYGISTRHPAPSWLP
jgi:hypothetical protein